MGYLEGSLKVLLYSDYVEIQFGNDVEITDLKTDQKFKSDRVGIVYNRQDGYEYEYLFTGLYNGMYYLKLGKDGFKVKRLGKVEKGNENISIK